MGLVEPRAAPPHLLFTTSSVTQRLVTVKEAYLWIESCRNVLIPSKLLTEYAVTVDGLVAEQPIDAPFIMCSSAHFGVQEQPGFLMGQSLLLNPV